MDIHFHKCVEVEWHSEAPPPPPNNTYTHPLLCLVNKHCAIKAGLLLIRVLCIRQEMLGKLHLIALELADHHHGNEPTLVP